MSKELQTEKQRLTQNDLVSVNFFAFLYQPFASTYYLENLGPLLKKLNNGNPSALS